ncbi:fimbrial biogenesis usher protein [Serratia ureilytica]|uniref:fimbrial biogenesis usher protein n=1 Tax=Serratia ureilytica TaxID=300181 RepID=UPI0034C69D2A
MLVPIAVIAVPVLPASADLHFNPRFLVDNPEAVADLSQFEKGLELPPGTYRVDMYLNDTFVSTRDILFQTLKGQSTSELTPCFNGKQLLGLGVNTSSLPSIDEFANSDCVPLAALVPGATQRFDISGLRLYLTVPQIYMGNKARGYISPENWDNGISAARLNYSLTGNRAKNRNGGTSQYAYMNLNGGVNIGPWRLRDNSTWSYNSGSGNYGQKNDWKHISTYVERDIAFWRSRLTVGDASTFGDFFDGIQFRGVRISSDDNMLPDSLRGFAPVIRDIAKSTARVSIRQNGFEIYQITVPPGAFEINDLYATNSGDLQVTIHEADGTSREFNVPYSSVPSMLREGTSRYELMLGEFRSGGSGRQTPKFAQGTLVHGFSDGWTLYGGAQVSDKYRALNTGFGKNMGSMGAASFDVTDATATLPDDSKHRGQSLRFMYNKSLNETGTNIQLVGYRYSTQGYFTLSDTTWERMSGYTVQTQDGPVLITPQYSDYYNLAYSKRGRIQISVSQQIDRQTSMYLSASRQSYWQTGRADEQIQAGLNSVLGGINWNMNYSLTRNAWQEERDHLMSFNMSIPFSYWTGYNNRSIWRDSRMSYSMSTDFDRRMTHLAGVSGALAEDKNLSYSLQTGYSIGGVQDRTSTGYASMNYTGKLANMNIGYSYNDSYSQLYYGISGGVIAHENGVTLSQPLNETVVLVSAPGAGNVKIEGQNGVLTDSRGYAVIPYATNYRENRIALDTNSLENNVELHEPVKTVIPSRGAVVRANFKPSVGMKVLMTLNYKGKPVPFGATATAEGVQAGSIVADGGQVYLTGLPMNGRLQAKWGRGQNQQCTAEYRLPKESSGLALSNITVECR